MNSLLTARRAPLAPEAAALMAWSLTARAICLSPLLGTDEYTSSRRLARGANLPPVRPLVVWPLTAQATCLRRSRTCREVTAAGFIDSRRTAHGPPLPPCRVPRLVWPLTARAICLWH